MPMTMGQMIDLADDAETEAYKTTKQKVAPPYFAEAEISRHQLESSLDYQWKKIREHDAEVKEIISESDGFFSDQFRLKEHAKQLGECKAWAHEIQKHLESLDS